MAWILTVTSAIHAAIKPATIKIHQLIDIRYAKSANHVCMAYHAIGKAISDAMITSFRKSFDKSITIVPTLAPNTLRMPISLMRCVMAKEESPSNPKQAISMAIQEKIVNRLLCFCSDWYKRLKFSSRKLYSKGISGKETFQDFSMVCITSFTLLPLTLTDNWL